LCYSTIKGVLKGAKDVLTGAGSRSVVVVVVVVVAAAVVVILVAVVVLVGVVVVVVVVRSNSRRLPFVSSVYASHSLP